MRYRFFSRMPLLFEADTGANAPGGTSQGQPTGQQTDPAQALDNLITRHNNDMRAVVELLYRENHGYRDQIRTLQGQLPGEGQAVLSTEDATRWQALQDLGDPTQLRQTLQEGQAAGQQLATLRQEVLLRDVASIADFDREVLQTIGGSLTYVIKDEQVQGKPAKVVYVKDGDQETALSTYAEQKWQKFLPSLRGTSSAAPARGTPAGQQPPRQQQSQQEAPRRPLVRL